MKIREIYKDIYEIKQEVKNMSEEKKEKSKKEHSIRSNRGLIISGFLMRNDK